MEVYTPSGNWSSYPPHKHDVHRVDDHGQLIEADLEEVYFYKLDRPQGYAVQRVYTTHGSLDETLVARDNDIVLVPEGYHPVGSAPGYTTYYLNFLAGSPATSFRRFVLDEVLQKVQTDLLLQQALAPQVVAERGGLAFEIWAGSMLSHLGYSCEVRVYDGAGQLASDFAVDMPTGPEDPARDLLEEVRVASDPVVHSSEEAGSPVSQRAYRGGAAVRSEDRRRELGAVLVTLPYAEASLDLAPNPRTRTPEVLRNTQAEGIGPRIDESESLVLAWIERGVVVQSSASTRFYRSARRR